MQRRRAAVGVRAVQVARAARGMGPRGRRWPTYDGSGAGSDRRRSLLGRFRARRDAPAAPTTRSSTRRSTRSSTPRQAGGSAPIRPRAGAGRRGARARGASTARGRRAREPRHVRAVPTSIEHKIASAVELFNASEHPRRWRASPARWAADVSVRPRPCAGRRRWWSPGSSAGTATRSICPTRCPPCASRARATSWTSCAR